MIPQDIQTAKLKKLSRLRKYVANNIKDWYSYVKHTLGHDIENGDLRVVYSCRKSAAFGIATAFNQNRGGETQLTFCTDNAWGQISGCPYRWNHIGSAETKAGSSAHDNDSTLPAQNMCLFVNTIDVKVSSEVWYQIESLGSAPVQLGNSASLEPSPRAYSHVATQEGTANPQSQGVEHSVPYSQSSEVVVVCSLLTLN